MLKQLNKLCTPSYVYFVLSMLSLILMGIQNLGNMNRYCVGHFECQVTNTLGIFIGKFIYILFWTWMLNVFCKAGYKNVAWFVLFLPFIMMFVLIALLLLHRI
jgi:hypothetical protein